MEAAAGTVVSDGPQAQATRGIRFSTHTRRGERWMGEGGGTEGARKNGTSAGAAGAAGTVA